MKNNQPIHYCYVCGGELVQADENGFFRERCPQCGNIHYQQYKVGVAAIILDEGRLLLVKRKQAPWKGYWNFPAGFLEIEEEPEEAVVREVKEEAGLIVRVKGFRLLFPYHDDPRGDGIVMFYDCENLGGQFQANDEASDCRLFSPDELPQKIAGAGHRAMVKILKNGGFRYD
jgi:ADP-ribose pyrophosphatase YjhB (NUDIX family)